MNRLDGKVAIVTGAGQGIGFAIAASLAQEGARVAIAELNPDTAISAAATISASGAAAIGLPCDVSKRPDVDATVSAVMREFGRIDVLVNNAHYLAEGFDRPLVDENEDNFMRHISTGLMGTFYFMQACHPHLQEGGKVINVASAAGILGFERLAAYSAAKEGIRGLSRVAAREWGRLGINVNCICPSVPSDAILARRERLGLVVNYDDRPIPRPGTGEDIGRVVVFLATDDSAYVTGQTLLVDGGRTMIGGV